MSLSKLVETKPNITSFEVPNIVIPSHNMTVQEATHKLYDYYKDRVVVKAAMSSVLGRVATGANYMVTREVRLLLKLLWVLNLSIHRTSKSLSSLYQSSLKTRCESSNRELEEHHHICRKFQVMMH